MRVKELCEKMNLQPLTGDAGMEREVDGAYVSDLLSWVMSHAQEGNVWITIQSHANVIAVACLVDLSCIIVAEDVEVDEDTIQKAVEKGMPVFTTSQDAYSVCCELCKLGV